MPQRYPAAMIATTIRHLSPHALRVWRQMARRSTPTCDRIRQQHLAYREFADVCGWDPRVMVTVPP